jgi:hypothetical protein
MTPKEHTQTSSIYINQIHTNIELNPTYESNGRINFLDLLIPESHPTSKSTYSANQAPLIQPLFPFKPPHRTQSSRFQIPYYHTALAPINTSEERKRMDINTANCKKQ